MFNLLVHKITIKALNGYYSHPLTFVVLSGDRSLRRIVVHASVCCAQISRTQRGIDAGML
jgi:hypothetical protein